MGIFQAIILGIVQGLTEMLPVSSSAHLYFIPRIFGWGEIGEFDIALHLGTLLVVISYFYKDWLALFKGGYRQLVKKEKSLEGKMFWYLVAASIPGGAIGFILDHVGEELMTNGYVISIALIVMGILLYLVDKFSKRETDYEHMSFKQAFLIGCSQALACIPGISRSGATITAARALGLKRRAAARYSFMLSTPIIFGAVVYKIGDYAWGELSFYLGVLASFLVGAVVIRFLLHYLKKGSYKAFAIYRMVIGLIALVYTILA